MTNKPLGKHIIAEFYECNSSKIDDLEYLKISGSTLVDVMFHKFSPQGVTGIALIMESHLSVHTWPENNYVAIDFFTCNLEIDPLLAIHYLKDKLECKRPAVKTLDRGTEVSLTLSNES